MKTLPTMWPVRVDAEMKTAFEQAAAELRISVSELRRLAYEEYISNHPDFFAPIACERTQPVTIGAQEVA